MNNKTTASEIADELRRMADDDIRNFRRPLKIEFFLNEVWSDQATQNEIVAALLAGNKMENGIPVGIHTRVIGNDSGRPVQLYFFHASFPNPIEVRLPLERANSFIASPTAACESAGAVIQPLGIEPSTFLN